MADHWYKDGLKFKCEGLECGDCCSGRWGTGYVWVTKKEMRKLADHLGIEFDEFTSTYVRAVGNRYSLIEKRNFDCIFYVEGKGCQVYDARPNQCRNYPFWPGVVKTRTSWEEESEQCPGINCGEKCDLYSAKKINKLREATRSGKGIST